jgi:L-fucose mutarotase
MLKGIPKIISPQLMKIMMEMGHGDELIIADGNFPSAANAKRLIRADGHNVPEILDAILKFFPIDQYDKTPVTLMQVVEGDTTVPVIWDKYVEVINNNNYEDKLINHIDRFEFYDRAKDSYAIIATGEEALYGNIIIKKGVV